MEGSIEPQRGESQRFSPATLADANQIDGKPVFFFRFQAAVGENTNW
jgi:hypothetical protein